MDFEERIARFREMISECENIVFFGGAGVSTESGIKDYRSEDGMYNTVREYGVSPETILSRSFFERNPETFYDFYYKYFLTVAPEPNDAHFALAKLEEQGRLKCVITQNIDDLHSKAGSRNVLELHGTCRENSCPKCRTPYPTKSILALKGRVPRCEKCGSVINTGVVLYEDSLNEKTVRRTVEAISSADMLIIGGTSLSVYPAASFIRYFSGKYTVLINRTPTPCDDTADLIFREKIGTVMKKVLNEE